MIQDAHTSHCCALHGCKYGDSGCIVTTGKAKQEDLCEDCENAQEECQPLQNIINEYLSKTGDEAHQILLDLQDRLITEHMLYRDPPLQEREQPAGEITFTFEEAVHKCMDVEATRMQQRSHYEIVQMFLRNPWMDWSEERVLSDFRDGLAQSIAMREFVCQVFVESQKGGIKHKVYDRAEDPDIPKE